MFEDGSVWSGQFQSDRPQVKSSTSSNGGLGGEQIPPGVQLKGPASVTDGGGAGSGRPNSSGGRPPSAATGARPSSSSTGGGRPSSSATGAGRPSTTASNRCQQHVNFCACPCVAERRPRVLTPLIDALPCWGTACVRAARETCDRGMPSLQAQISRKRLCQWRRSGCRAAAGVELRAGCGDGDCHGRHVV